MKENIKTTQKILYTMCICLVIVMGILFLGNSLTKGTHSIGTVLTKDTPYCSKIGYEMDGNECCPSGYSLWGITGVCCPSGYSLASKQRMECVNGFSERVNAIKSEPVSICKAGNILNGNTCTAKCENETQGECIAKYGANNCVLDKNNCWVKNEVGCYIANNRYQWSTVDLGSPWKKVDIPKANCSGCAAGYVENNDGVCIKKQISSITITFMNGDTKVKTESCTVPSGSQSCTNSIVAPGPQTSSDSNKVFNGWGEKDGCTSGSYTANAALRPTASRVYYACYRDASGDNKPSTDFSANKCTYSSLYTVTRDTRYLNCKYTNITYNNSATEDTVGNVSACCSAKGYMWVGENFTSSGYGNEYCLVCEGSSGGTTPTNPDKPDNPSNPSSTPSSTPSNPSNITDNPKTGSVAIFLVWIIALGTLVYAGVYFKQARENN